ncbi:flagellar hook-associated protein FlgL [Herbaspirillum rhizosphaerae]|uniref:Flagellar hook-associated protein FlgL n=1 Tax=Herbaspirillum rhizosphaerae TaxID=346179 RepID=A0ABW8Z528_9BURK
MRISTSMLYQLSNTELTSMQSSILKLNQQVTANQKVLNPSDDAVASARALDLSQTQALNAQYATNRQNANSSLDQVNGVLGSVTDMLTKLKSNGIAAGNATYTNAERSNLASELQGNLKEMLGFANSTDGQGNYLFAGFKSTTQPFSADPTTGNIVYNGDQGALSLQVDSSRQMEISASGTSIFQGGGQDIFQTMQSMIALLAVPVTEAANKADADAANAYVYPAGSGQTPILAYKNAQAALDAAQPTDPNYATLLSTAAAAKLTSDAANAARTPVTGSQEALTRGLNKLGATIDKEINNVGSVTASVGARQKELDNLDAAGLVKNESYTQTANDLLGRNPSDLADSISALSLQSTYLQAAQKSFVTTSSLSLLNYLK